MDLSPDVSLLIDRAERQRKDIVSQLYRLRNLKGGITKEARDRQLEITRESITELAQLVDELPLVVEDVVATEAHLQSLRIRVKKLQEDFKALKLSLRTAILESKKTVENIAVKEREELLKVGDPNAATSISGRNLTAESSVLNATSNLTASLHRTTALMRTNLSQSSAQLESLTHSTNTLKSTTSQYSNMDDLLTYSKKLIKKLQRSDVVDRIIILAALIWFLIVVAYIVKRRTVDRGVRLVGWIWSNVGGSSHKSSAKITQFSKPLHETVSLVMENVESSIEDILDQVSNTLTAATASFTTSAIEHAEL